MGSDALSTEGERHDDAVGRLEAALAEQDRRRRQHEAAACTSPEPDAYARLCEANERLAAREKWLDGSTAMRTEKDRERSARRTR